MSQVASTLNVEDENLTARQRRRLQDRKEWEAYWNIRLFDAQGTWWPLLTYKVHRFFDRPVTWFREKIVEPLHDKNALPYYHRRFARVPEIDQCGVLEDFEQSELNHFIKYGELGCEADVRSAYMKQKHRLIWERRHPEIMQERERAYQEYLDKKRDGEFDMSFWKKGLIFQDRKNFEARGADMQDHLLSKPAHEGDKPLSTDWKYYQKVAQDPEFDKEQGKKSRVPIFT